MKVWEDMMMVCFLQQSDRQMGLAFVMRMTMHTTLKIVRIGLNTHYSVQAVSLDFLMLLSRDINFVGYTYKNFEIVNDYQVPGMTELKKKNTKSKRPTIKSLFEHESESSEIASQ
ncbi:hypothetical protein BUALT_Bualt16G0100600 [Buddleja alternifolia]|uniref:Uncharacterized protein n=1 Tax=Buddleja alternifolia TaxID=168488 RepID=A0AAV6WLA3_9LAMI|nr:hypothetical protein BUALT_Bualt16G0100600 [Buddleja alternifolia]